MNSNRAPQPYGPAYQQMCADAAIAAGCKRNAMSVFYCLMHQRGLWDWTTGQTTREISHKALAKALGGADYKTIQRGVTALREAGVLGYADHRGRGVVWSDGTGKANRYKLLLPPMGDAEDEQEDPTQKTGRPLTKKRADPYPKNGKHYHSPIYPNGAEAAPSRREGDKAPLIPDTDRGGEPVPFGELVKRHGFGRALEIEKAAQAASVAAE